jgi:hypothetical protein
MATSCVKHQPINHQNHCAKSYQDLRLRLKWFFDVLVVQVDINGYFLICKVFKFGVSLPDITIAIVLHLLDPFNWFLNLKWLCFFPLLKDCNFFFQFLIFRLSNIALNLIGLNNKIIIWLIDFLFFYHHRSYLIHELLIKETNRSLSMILLKFPF